MRRDGRESYLQLGCPSPFTAAAAARQSTGWRRRCMLSADGHRTARDADFATVQLRQAMADQELQMSAERLLHCLPPFLVVGQWLVVFCSLFRLPLARPLPHSSPLTRHTTACRVSTSAARSAAAARSGPRGEFSSQVGLVGRSAGGQGWSPVQRSLDWSYTNQPEHHCLDVMRLERRGLSAVFQGVLHT